MRKLAFIPLLLIAAQAVTVSCCMAPSQDDGDTVAAKEFYPPDTAALRKAAANDSTVTKAVTDSADIFVIGPASTKHEVQLLSYPSRRDSTLYYKSRRIKVRGNADVGHVVRAVFFTTEKGDTIVTRITELKQEAANVSHAPQGHAH